MASLAGTSRAKAAPSTYRRTGIIAAWGLAAAASIVAVVSWQNWRTDHVRVVNNKCFGG